MAPIDTGRVVDVVYLDFRKAFEFVSHNILTGKLVKKGKDERSARWIKHWQTVRAQRVVITSIESSWRPVGTSVPHKLVLGLVLFNI